MQNFHRLIYSIDLLFETMETVVACHILRPPMQLVHHAYMAPVAMQWTAQYKCLKY